MDLYLGTLTNKLYLNGASISLPMQGAAFVLKSGPQTPTGRIVPMPMPGQTRGLGDLVEDQLTVSLVGAVTDIDAWILSIERMFESALLWQTRRIGTLVGLGCQVDTNQGYWVSPVINGWLEQIGGGPADRAAGGLAVRLHVIRQNWWESANYTSLNLSNLQGSNTKPLNVYNHNDSGHSSYVEIAAASVQGSLPARTIVIYNNGTNDSLSLRNLYISHNIFAAPATLNLILEADNGTQVQGQAGGTKTADSSCSGGYYQAVTWMGTAATLLEYWTIAGADVDKFAGSECHAVARLRDTFNYTDLWFQWQIQSGSTALWSSPWVLGTPDQNLEELPLVRIPPWFLSGLGSSSSMKLCLYARRDSGTSQALNIDFIQLMPQDGYRKLEAVAPVPFNYDLRDNGTMGILETVNEGSGNAVSATHVGRGEQIELHPNTLQRIYFLCDTDDGSAAISRQGWVTIYYYPRVRAF